MFSRVGVAPKEKCRSQNNASSHQTQPATIIAQPAALFAPSQSSTHAIAHSASSTARTGRERMPASRVSSQLASRQRTDDDAEQDAGREQDQRDRGRREQQ